MDKENNINKGENYIKSRSKEYRTIVLVCVAILIVVVVLAVVLSEALKVDTQKVKIFDENGNEIGVYEEGKEPAAVKNKLGYDFSGWVDTETGIVYNTLDEALNAGCNSVKQKWELKVYTLTLYIRDGKIIGDDSYVYHEAVDDKGPYYTKTYTIETDDILLPNSTNFGHVKVEKLNYAFMFWSQLPSSEDYSTSIQKIQKGATRNTTLYAVWNEDPNIVNFIDKDGKNYFQYKLNYNDIIERPEDVPEKEGYEFGGYYSDKDFKQEYVFGKEMLAKYLSIYIKWIPKEYKIEYYKGDDLIYTKTYHTDEVIEEYKCPLNGTEGKTYQFKHWTINNSTSIFDLEKMPPNDLKLYAVLDFIQYEIKWNIDGKEYLQTYHYADMPSCNLDTSKDPSNTIVYKFSHWYVDVNENGQYDEGEEGIKAVENSTTYYAYYQESIRKYSYKIYGANEQEPIKKGEAEYETVIDFPTGVTKDSTVDKVYTFAGWCVDKNKPEEKIEDDSFVIKEDTIFYAIFDESTRKYTVTFYIYNSESGKIDKNYNDTGYSIEYGSKLPEELKEYKVGYSQDPKTYSFDFWTIDFDTKVDFNTYTVVGDVEIYAKYESSADKYILKFYKNEIISEESYLGEKKIDIGDPAEFWSNPTKEADKEFSYTFSCWYIDKNGNDKYDEDEAVTIDNNPFGEAQKNQEFLLFAHYDKAKIKYTLTLKTDEDTTFYSAEVENGSEINLDDIGIPEKEGYTFGVWDGIPEDNIMPTDDLTLYATWTINQYTITFRTSEDTSEESVFVTITQDYGSVIQAPEAPKKEGYTFIEWSPKIPETMPAKDVTITAQWTINQYTITFDTVGGTEIASITQDYGSEITAPADPTKEGYTFIRWDKDIPATMPAEDVKITAQWIINQYKITFRTSEDISEENVFVTIIQDYGSAIQAPEDPKNEGYTFAGWDKEIPETMPAKDVTIIAQWTINQYTITFNTDGGSEIASITQDYGSEITAPAKPTKEGYSFDGWDKEIPETMPAKNVTITAQWTINQYTITFDTVGGSKIASITQNYGSEITTEVGTPTKTGYTFNGWDTEIPETMPAEDITITAQWTINQYTITFDTVGGSEIASITQDYGTEITTVVGTPTKEGYTFIEWSPKIPETMPAGDVTITAQWSANEYKVSFNTVGGSEIAKKTVTYGEKYGELLSPSKAHYEFTGWKYIDADVEVDITSESIVNIASNHTLVACWKLKEYTITFVNPQELNITTNSIKFTIEDKIELNQNFVIDSFVFEGWYEDENYSSTPVTSFEAGVKDSDFTLYGNWYTEGLTFSKNETGDEYYISAYDKTKGASHIFIPRVYEGIRVTTVKEAVFKLAKTIEKVTMDNIITVENYAFSGCTKLKNVSMKKVEVVGESAFMACTSLENVDMRNVETIKSGAFSVCTNLNTIKVSTALTIVGESAFDSEELKICYNGTEDEFNSIDVDASVKSIFVWSNVEQYQ